MSNNLWPQPNLGGSGGSNLIAGRYELGVVLGEGGFGKVYVAQDRKFQPARTVAIKILDQSMVNTAELREAILKETGALAQFSHPNILRVLDYEISSSLAYIVTEYAGGGSLQDKILNSGTGLPLQQVDNYLKQIAAGLDEAHKNNIIHRDLKPQNILLDKNDYVLLADFGLAIDIGSLVTHKTLTVVMGTPEYVAPEVWDQKVSKASDIYAVGVLLYQIMTGQLPFQGSLTSVMKQHITDPVPSLLAKLPYQLDMSKFDVVIARAMAKDPKDRYSSATELYRAFNAIFLSPVAVPPPSAISSQNSIKPTPQSKASKLGLRSIKSPTTIASKQNPSPVIGPSNPNSGSQLSLVPNLKQQSWKQGVQQNIPFTPQPMINMPQATSARAYNPSVSQNSNIKQINPVGTPNLKSANLKSFLLSTILGILYGIFSYFFLRVSPGTGIIREYSSSLADIVNICVVVFSAILGGHPTRKALAGTKGVSQGLLMTLVGWIVGVIIIIMVIGRVAGLL